MTKLNLFLVNRSKRKRNFKRHSKHRQHVDLTVLSLFQKAVTFDYNLTH